MKVLVKILKVIYSIISWILTPILSIVLVVGLVATALIGSVSNLVTPASITNMVQEGVSSIILENEEITAAFEEMGLSAETTQKLAKSKFMGDFLNAYIGDMTDALSGKTVEQSSISPEKIKEIVNTNIDEVVDIFKDVIPEEEKPATDEELKEQILKMANESAEEIVQMLPDPKALSELLQNPSGNVEDLFPNKNTEDSTENLVAVSGDEASLTVVSDSVETKKYASSATAEPDISSALTIIQQFINNSFTWYAILFCAVIALLIFVLRLRKFGGLLWIGICCLISAVIVTAFTALLSVGGALINDVLPISFDISFILNELSEKLTTSLIILYACGILSIAGFIVIKIFRKKKAEKIEEVLIAEDGSQEVITDETVAE